MADTLRDHDPAPAAQVNEDRTRRCGRPITLLLPGARAFEGRATIALAIVVAIACRPARVGAQATAAPDPHTVQAERPTVATHAYTVAPGWVELEAGVQRQQQGALTDRVAVPVVVKIGLARWLQLDVAPGWQRDAQNGRIESGITDMFLALKWRVADHAALLGAFALQTTVSMPTGSADAGRGTGSAGLNLLVISSHQVGPVSVDANVGYTRLGGDGTNAPKNSTMWTVAAGLPLAGRFGWDVEVFGYPATSGPAGTRPVVAFLAGPTFTVRRYLVLDAGATFDLEGFGGTAIYAGLTWNVGRLWGVTPSRAARRGVTLVTADTKDFARVDGLMWEDWSRGRRRR